MRTDSRNMKSGLVERPPRPLPNAREFLGDLKPRYAINGFVGLVFSATSPTAVILAVGQQGGLTQAQLASWVFGVFFLNGSLTVLAMMAAIPMPIVMGMVAGVFLSFGLDLVHALARDAVIALPMLAAFLVLACKRRHDEDGNRRRLAANGIIHTGCSYSRKSAVFPLISETR
ncbi:MAG: benzoate/H(+) symporter BenE family transporter [Saccharopolyspora sp.]|nr:benzoate/H(+) symporter BenE family transporter [Saccharopolyspora sp.]